MGCFNIKFKLPFIAERDYNFLNLSKGKYV